MVTWDEYSFKTNQIIGEQRHVWRAYPSGNYDVERRLRGRESVTYSRALDGDPFETYQWWCRDGMPIYCTNYPPVVFGGE